MSQIKGRASAAEQLAESEFISFKDRIEIRTALSKTMLPVIFDLATLEDVKKLLLSHGVESVLSVKARDEAGKLASSAIARKIPSLDRLKKSATLLNSISDRISKQVQELDASLKKLNLGVSTWVECDQSSDEDGTLYQDFIGYSKFNSRWCIALRSGYSRPDGLEREEIWPFADGPRSLRIKAVEKIPDLVEKLSIEAEELVSALSATLEKVEHFTQNMRESA